MILPKFAEILTILSQTKDLGVSTKELFKLACDNQETVITDPEMLSKLIYSMRSAKLITTSEAGTNKIHKITPNGIAALAEFNAEPTQFQETAMHTIETETTTATPEPQAEPEQPTQQPTIIHDNVTDNDFYLDPKNELENAMITIARAQREIRQQPPAIKIANKAKKIDTLSRLGALMSDDINAIFTDIRHDLSQLLEDTD